MDNDYPPDTEIVKLQCERYWRQLRDVQAELLKSVTPVSVQNTDLNPENNTSSRLHILQELEKRLKAELQDVKERELKTLPESADLQLLVLEQDQMKKLESLKETLTYAQGLRSEVLGDIKQEEELYSSLSSLNDALKVKVAAVSEASGDETGKTLQSALTEMTTKLNKVTEMNKYLKKILKNILSTNFSVPHPSQNKDSDASNMVSLRSLVGRLIEQSLNSPEQPYVDIDNSVWPPHVEFLLRCQIALKDPRNSHRMKLVPFHL